MRKLKTKIGYRGLHNWINRNVRKPNKCEFCNKVTIQLDAACVTYKYNRDPRNWKYICKSCHQLYDRKRRHNKPKIKLMDCKLSIPIFIPKISTPKIRIRIPVDKTRGKRTGLFLK